MASSCHGVSIPCLTKHNVHAQLQATKQGPGHVRFAHACKSHILGNVGGRVWLPLLGT
jgi:hypothetical protein